jgi:hypothetical protein
VFVPRVKHRLFGSWRHSIRILIGLETHSAGGGTLGRDVCGVCTKIIGIGKGTSAKGR